jgi:hypothetical protein
VDVLVYNGVEIRLSDRRWSQESSNHPVPVITYTLEVGGFVRTNRPAEGVRDQLLMPGKILSAQSACRNAYCNDGDVRPLECSAENAPNGVVVLLKLQFSAPESVKPFFLAAA